MGVQGLWRLIEPSGKPVPLETLENKVLAIDVSIWLHQAIKGFQDSKGSPVANAHLLAVFHRICKLLYFKIKPVFVFDGGVPILKKETIAKRNQLKHKTQSEADRIHKHLLNTLLKHTAINKVLSEKAKAEITSPVKKSRKNVEDNIYALPPSELDSTITSSSDEDESAAPKYSNMLKWDLHSIDTNSGQFRSLPLDVRHEILTDLKETRKQSSWGRINELPTQSDDFSVFQMNRLLKRQAVQDALQAAEKEMGGHSLSLGELETILKDQGVITSSTQIGCRIASDENKRYLLIKDIKQALTDAKKKEDILTVIEEEVKFDEDIEKEKNKGDLEFENDLKSAIALSLQEEPSTSKATEQVSTTVPSKTKRKKLLQFSFLEGLGVGDFDSDTSEDLEIENSTNSLTSAQSYMIEYSGLTPTEIAKIMETKTDNRKTKNTDECPNQATKSIDFDSDKNMEPSKEQINLPDDVLPKPDSTSNLEIQDMSDGSSSNDEFLEVSDEDEDVTIQEKSNHLEILVDPNQNVDDDLFKDIFEEKTESSDVIKNITQANDDVFEKDLNMITHDKNHNTEQKLIVSKINNDTNQIDKVKSLGKPSLKERLFKSLEVIQKSNNPRLGDNLSDAEKKHEETNRETDKVELVDTVKPSSKEEIETMVEKYSSKTVETSKLSLKQMEEMRDKLRQEEVELKAKKSAKERLASNITDQMYQETQELLELFGVPYLIAPMEAEAQCAFLDEIHLTDGTITNDSDIWLFGGRTVYKNFFDNKKTVLEFKAESIQHNFKLTRDQLILLALLVGSDYTTGLAGVGPVTALEILAAFPPKTATEFHLSQLQLLSSGLSEFRSWLIKGKTPGPGRTALRSKLKNVSITDNFPNPQVLQAYLQPTVETSDAQFSWAKPDVAGLCEFARIKFGWTKSKCEEILKPVLKRLDERKSQTLIREYFYSKFKVDGDDVIENKMSKRVRSAIKKIGGGGSGAAGNDDDDDNREKPKRKKIKKTNVESSSSEKIDEDIEVLKTIKKVSKRKVQEIEKQVKNIEQRITRRNLHKKEVIPQKQLDKTNMIRAKLKAIEVFRKSKQGPGYVVKKKKVVRQPKEDAGLSESSDDNE